MFFLNFYKEITLVSLITIFFGLSYLLSPEYFGNIFFQVFILIGSVVVTNFSIKFTGLDKVVELELRKIAKKKGGK